MKWDLQTLFQNSIQALTIGEIKFSKILKKLLNFFKQFVIYNHKEIKMEVTMKTLTDNEKMVLKALVENAKSEGGVEFIIDDVADNLGKSKCSLAGTLASLQNKELIDCFCNSYYYDGQVREQAIEWYNNNF